MNIELSTVALKLINDLYRTGLFGATPEDTGRHRPPTRGGRAEKVLPSHAAARLEAQNLTAKEANEAPPPPTPAQTPPKTPSPLLTIPTSIRHLMHIYSQSDEQRAILRYFGDTKGRFLDIGAYDGVRLSNTRALLELGWSGVLVEPSAANLVNLSRNCEAFAERVRIVQAAVSDRCGLSEFYVDTAPDREWSTTINPDLAASGSVIAPRALKTSVATIRIHDLLKLGPYDFISLDAEWEDLKILRDFVLCWPTENLPRMICAEARDAAERAEMRSLLSLIGYSDFHDTRENLLMVRG